MVWKDGPLDFVIAEFWQEWWEERHWARGPFIPPARSSEPLWDSWPHPELQVWSQRGIPSPWQMIAFEGRFDAIHAMRTWHEERVPGDCRIYILVSVKGKLVLAETSKHNGRIRENVRYVTIGPISAAEAALLPESFSELCSFCLVPLPSLSWSGIAAMTLTQLAERVKWGSPFLLSERGRNHMCYFHSHPPFARTSSHGHSSCKEGWERLSLARWACDQKEKVNRLFGYKLLSAISCFRKNTGNTSLLFYRLWSAIAALLARWEWGWSREKGRSKGTVAKWYWSHWVASSLKPTITGVTKMLFYKRVYKIQTPVIWATVFPCYTS